MTISVIHANSSISVMPGSETLCSVHSGQALRDPQARLGDQLLEASVVERDLGEPHALSSAGMT